MSNIVLQSSAGGSGAVTIAAPETNTPLAYQLPKSSGKVSVLAASSALTLSGTSVAFTGIPDDARRITIPIAALSTNGTSNPQIQLGTSGGFVTTGYNSTSAILSSGISAQENVTGFAFRSVVATYVLSGVVTLVRLSGNTWAAEGQVMTGATSSITLCGHIDLSGTLDRIRLTTVNGTDTFDSGTISIIVE